MTIKELSQLYWLNKEIEYEQTRLEELRSTIASASSSKINGMPGNSSATGSKLECLMPEIIDLEAIIAAKQIQCIHERQRLERYIATVPDSLTRMIMTFRFIKGLTWNQVARNVGGGNTPDALKKRCYRYLDSTVEQKNNN